MKIRFKTKDNVVCIKECPDISHPLTVVMSPMWVGVPTLHRTPTGFMEYRRYEFHGEVIDGIPTVVEHHKPKGQSSMTENTREGPTPLTIGGSDVQAEQPAPATPLATPPPEGWADAQRRYYVDPQVMRDIHIRFTYHPPKSDQAERYETIRSKARELADLIMRTSELCREQSIAITKLQEAVMWANAAIACNEATAETP